MKHLSDNLTDLRLIVALLCFGCCLQPALGCMTNPLISPDRIRFTYLYDLEDNLAFVHPVRNLFYIYNPETGNWTTKPAAQAFAAPAYTVIDQQLIYAAPERSDLKAIDIIDFSGAELKTRTIYHTSTETVFSLALQVSKTIIFCAFREEGMNIVFADIETNATRNFNSSIPATTAANDEERLFVFHHSQTLVYHVKNDNWTTVNLTALLPDNNILHARMYKGSALLITKRNIFLLDIWSGRWETIMQINFAMVYAVVIHNDMLFMTAGPSLRFANTIFTYNLLSKDQFSWVYDEYNFESSPVAVADEKLYILNSDPNADSSSFILVYDFENAQYDLEHVPNWTFENWVAIHYTHVQDGEYLVIPNYAWTNPQVLLYNLNNGLWDMYPWTNARSDVVIHSNDQYLVVAGGTLDTLRPSSDVDIYSWKEHQWTELIVSRDGSYRSMLVDDSIFFYDFTKPETKHCVEVFTISNASWNSHNLTDGGGRFTTLKSHGHLLFIAESATVIDIYDIAARTWKSLPLSIPRRKAAIIEADPYLFIAGGAKRSDVTDIIDTLDLHTMTFVDLGFRLSEARSDIAAAVLYPWVVFIGGRLASKELSATIDVFDLKSNTSFRMPLPQPELIGLTFGVVGIPTNHRLYLRFNSHLYIIDLWLHEVEAFLLPSMAGNNIVALDKLIIAHGDFLSEGVFFFMDTTTNTFWVMSTIHYSPLFNPLITWNNYAIILADGLTLIQFPQFLNRMDNVVLAPNQTVVLQAYARGRNITYQWLFNDQVILGEKNDRITLHGNSSLPGRYTALVRDRCQRLTSQSAEMSILPPPVFTSCIADRMILCSTPWLTLTTEFSKDDLSWTLDEQPIPVQPGERVNERKVPVSSLKCGTTHKLCAIASNPSGKSTCCSSIAVVHVDSIFKGPKEESRTFVSHGSTVNLTVEILDARCTSHHWYMDDVLIQSSAELSSWIPVDVKEETYKSQFYVIAYCLENSSTIRSASHTIKTDILPAWLLVLLIAGGLAVITASVAGLITFYKRLRRSKKQEIELVSLLNEAKQETMAQNGTHITTTSTWEWSPDESFSFRPLEKLPMVIDTSNLGFSKKSDPVDINLWVHGTVSFSTKETKRISALLLQSLVPPQVDIYAPQSPKFDIKVDPSSFSLLDSHSVITMTVSVRMKMTTKAKIRLVIVLEKEKIYSSIDFTLVSKPSPWIDVDDIEMSGQILGQGGFGTVTRGIYKGQDVAVKMLTNQVLMDYVRTEFEREVAMMKSLHHPNIIQFIGASNVVGKLALVTEFAPLGSLASALEKHYVPYNLKLAILLEIARAIQFLHSNNIIHRDIKPLNVLVFSLEHKSSVHVKLTDFGTSKFVSESTMTMTQNTGTGKYMAPETLGRKPRFDTSADLYSFAVLMWEVITNESAFNGPDFEWQSDIERFVTAGNRLSIPKEVDSRLARLISDCWAQDPTERPSIASVIQQLSALVYEQNDRAVREVVNYL